MKITEQQYHQIHSASSREDRENAEWRRRGFTVKRKKCGCMTAHREVIGLGETTITENCRKHSQPTLSVPIVMRIER